MYNFGLIGNCQVMGIVDSRATLSWLCLPRPDSAPVFGSLLDPDGGFLEVSSKVFHSSSQKYLGNTPILQTTIHCEDGVFIVTDFCPRFEQYGRIFRPTMCIRVVRPISGAPVITVKAQPVTGWAKTKASYSIGNSHLLFHCSGGDLRLSTDMSLTYLSEEREFTLRRPIVSILSWNTGIEESLSGLAEQFQNRTAAHWESWVRNCTIPQWYQKETIRSAITLKLHCFEDTGAILAAATTSLPEEVGGVRNWDYRLCWLRDSFFSLSAFRNLGQFDEMEAFISFFFDIARERSDFAPVYTLDRRLPLPEIEQSAWRGFSFNQQVPAYSPPVRSGNQAAEHVQNDVYGEMILTLAPAFLDERLWHLRTDEHQQFLTQLAQKAEQCISSKDAGLWELRDHWQEHTFTNLMCWAGLQKALRVAHAGYTSLDGNKLEQACTRAATALRDSVVDGSLRAAKGDASFDASLLLLPVFGYPDKQLRAGTLDALWSSLRLGQERPAKSFLFRYVKADDFGTPQSAFIVCSFWLAQALAAERRLEQAKEVMDDALLSANHLGLFSEHFDPHTGTQLGNFPQAYSHVGLINAAFAISPPWSEVI